MLSGASLFQANLFSQRLEPDEVRLAAASSVQAAPRFLWWFLDWRVRHGLCYFDELREENKGKLINC